MSASEIHRTGRPMQQNAIDAAKRHRANSMLRSGLAVVFLGLVFAGLFGRMMGYDLRRDELMFVPPAELLGEWRLYSDFFYNHVPNSAWFYRGFHLVFDEFGLLGSARLGVFSAWLLLVIGLAWVTFRISRSPALSLFSAVALLTCDTLLTQSGMTATNNLLPLPFAALGIGLFVSETIRRSPGRTGLVLAGLCLSIAAGMKVSAVMFIPPVAIGAFFLPRQMPMGHRLHSVVLPVLIGGLIGALPLFWYLLSDPELFLAHILKFHTGPHIAYWEANAASEPELALGLAGKLQLAYAVWLSGAALVMVLVLFYLVWLALRDASPAEPSQESYTGQILVVLGALGLTGVMGLMPTPGFPQYYVQPLICLPILSAIIFRRLTAARRQETEPVLGAAVVVLVILGLPRLAPGLMALTEPDAFVTAKMARGGAELSVAVADSAIPDGPIATFLPLYPLEAGLPVYAEFATGPFAYRVAEYTDPALSENYRMVGPQGLEELFTDNPPSAFLIGYNDALEAPLLRYARSNGYRQVDVLGLSNRYGKGVVYLKSAEASQ